MSAGLQVWNDSNYLQLDGETKQCVLLRRQTIQTAVLAKGIQNVTSWGSVPVNDGEFVAVAGDYPTCWAGKANGSMVLHFFAPPGASIDCFIFGAYQPSGLNYGMQIFNGSGELVYDTGRLPLRVVGEVAGVGTFTVAPPNRRLALWPWTQYIHVDRFSQAIGAGGSNPDVMLASVVTAGFGSTNYSGQVVVARNEYFHDAAGPVKAQSAPIGWPGSWDNNLDNKYTVIDVTGY